MERNKLILKLQKELRQIIWAGCSGDQALDERWDEAIAAVQNRIEQLLSLDEVDTVKEVLLPMRTILPCQDPSHSPPTHLYIPPGTTHTHTCPSCGFTCSMGSPVMFMSQTPGASNGP